LRAPDFTAGQEAIRMVRALIDKEPVSDVLLDSELIVRQSTTAIS
jgi:DNA-binding LacI/PurR family transcriptional regulator